MNRNRREIERETNSESQPKSTAAAAICSLKPQQNRNKMEGAIPKDPNRSTFSNTVNSDQLDCSQEFEGFKNAPVFRGRVSKKSRFKHNNVIPQDQGPSGPQDQEVSVLPQDQKVSVLPQDQEGSVIPQNQGASYNDSYHPVTNSNETSNTKKSAIHHQFWNCDVLSFNELKCVRKENLNYGKYLHTNCHSCKSFYSTSNPPYLQQCGISVCSVCNKKIKIRCDSCNSNCDQKSTSQNKDLINNSYFLLPAFKHLNLLHTVDKFLGPYTCDETLRGLDQFENKIVNLKEEIQSALKALESNLLDFEDNFSHVKKHMKYLMPPIRLMLESMNSSLELNWRKMSNFKFLMDFSCYVDNALYCLLKTIQTSDIQIGLRVKDFCVSSFGVDSNLTKFFLFFALLEKYEKRQYYPFILLKIFYYIGTHKNSDELEDKNIFVIDYGSLRRDLEAYGIFFQIQNEVNETHLIEIFFDEINGSLKEQLVLLCSGEEGPCYVGRNVVVDEDCLFIHSYTDDEYELCCDDLNLPCDDLIQSIPDYVGKFAVPEVFEVSVTRCFGWGTCIHITKFVIDEKVDIIGHVINPHDLNDISNGEWIIYNSGCIMSF